MLNPWLALPHTGDFVLPEDREAVHHFNLSSRREHLLHLDLRPEPFLGNLDTCSVFVLSGNPGLDETRDKNTHAGKEFSDASLRNLRGESEGIFFLEDRFQATPGGEWWRRCFDHLLRDELSWDQIRRAVAVIEHHPYHAKKWSLPSGLRNLPSFEYVRSKIVAALHQDTKPALIVILRAHELWKMRIPELRDRPNVIETRHIQSMKLTRNKIENPQDWNRIIAAVKKHAASIDGTEQNITIAT